MLLWKNRLLKLYWQKAKVTEKETTFNELMNQQA